MQATNGLDPTRRLHVLGYCRCVSSLSEVVEAAVLQRGGEVFWQDLRAHRSGSALRMQLRESMIALEVFHHFGPAILSGSCTFWKTLPKNSVKTPPEVFFQRFFGSQAKPTISSQDCRAKIIKNTSANVPSHSLSVRAAAKLDRKLHSLQPSASREQNARVCDAADCMRACA